MRNIKKLAVAGSAAVLGTAAALADGAPDASSIITTANTAFIGVGTLVAGAVGFFVIVKIVKWIRK